jgi:regulatory protein
MKTISEQEALHKAAAYCSGGERCISEVSEKLAKWQQDEKASERIISYLIKEKFIDEDRYCRSFVSDKLRFNKWGKIKISYILQQKRIPLHIIQSALQQTDEEKYIEMLTELLKEKKKSIKSQNIYEEQQKLSRFGAGRGFSSDEIRLALKIMLNEK